MIVTEARVRTPDGAATVVRLGGTIDDVGMMMFTHVPPAGIGDLVVLFASAAKLLASSLDVASSAWLSSAVTRGEQHAAMSAMIATSWFIDARIGRGASN